ncbi:PKD domain-containing protein [Candidatus Bipolaricaulota bacterium]|nr:PKD domain-containing protein [Candidatus Bipolaricaulota bacterium]
MRKWCWALVGGMLLLSGCVRVAPDPCRGAAPPLATFRVSAEGGELPLLVTLDATDSVPGAGCIVEYLWEFGDGTLGSGAVVHHKFDRDPEGPEEQEFRVVLTVIQELITDQGPCRLTGQAVRILRYGISRPLNVVRWEVKPTYHGSLIEGLVRNESADLRLTHGQVVARFYREPGHVLVGQAQRELWDIRPGEERLFMIATYLWPWEFDWVELRTEAFTAH